MRKIRRASFIITAVLLMTMMFTSTIFAEGSVNLVANGGYRPYAEFNGATSYGSGATELPREQIVKAYVEAGETVYFGDSVPNSWLATGASSNLAWQAGNDIRVTYPDGTYHYYNVEDGGLGHIQNYAQEQAGPSVLNSGVGYNALSFTAPATGIYKFRFCAPRSSASLNPVMALANSDEAFTANHQNIGVAAWDVTIADNGVKQNGRVFSFFLSLNMGGNTHNGNALNSVVYVLTADGYIYETDFNGMDPYGFLFFANNKGLVDLTTGNSFFHSTLCESNQMINVKGGIGFDLPINGEEDHLEITYRIFYQYPAPEVLTYFGLTQAEDPAEITDFKYNNGGSSVEGAGGTFSFTSDRDSTYQIEISFDPDDANNVITLGKTCVTGNNTIQWDGKDAYGDVVPEGTYTATIKMKGGEYHFPLADVEGNANGIKITMMNPPANHDANFNPSLIYYDHSNITSNGEYLQFTTETNNTYPHFTGSLTQLDGIDSSLGGALQYETENASTGFGNQKILDVWTFFSTADDIYTTSLVVDNNPPQPSGPNNPNNPPDPTTPGNPVIPTGTTTDNGGDTPIQTGDLLNFPLWGVILLTTIGLLVLTLVAAKKSK